jgi:branched-chain amino acid aminotransferase
VGEAASLAEASAALPDGAYTTLRTYGGRGIVRLEAHLQRLEESARALGDPGTLDRDAVRRLLTAALDATRHEESRLRLTLAPPRAFVSIEAFTRLPESLYEDGVACITLPRLHRDQPHVKDTHFIATAREAYRDLPDGIHEGLLVTGDGSILEGLTSNFFAVRDGTLYTEGERVLAGITRALVLEAAQSQVRVSMKAVHLRDLPRVSEAFITSTSRGVLPVVRLDRNPVGNGQVGQTTRAIMAAFAHLVRYEADARF